MPNPSDIPETLKHTLTTKGPVVLLASKQQRMGFPNNENPDAPEAKFLKPSKQTLVGNPSNTAPDAMQTLKSEGLRHIHSCIA